MLPYKETETPKDSSVSGMLAWSLGCSSFFSNIPSGLERVNTYTDPDPSLLLSSLPFAPISAVSPYKDTEMPKLSHSSGSCMWILEWYANVPTSVFERVNTYTDPSLLSRKAPINAVSPYKDTEIPKRTSSVGWLEWSLVDSSVNVPSVLERVKTYTDPESVISLLSPST